MSTAAFTWAKECEPYTLAFSDIPVHPEELTRDLLVHIGARVGVTFDADCVKEFWRVPRRPCGNQPEVRAHL